MVELAMHRYADGISKNRDHFPPCKTARIYWALALLKPEACEITQVPGPLPKCRTCG